MVMSEPFVQEVKVPVASRFRQLVNRSLGDDEFARELLGPETRVRALQKLGLEEEQLEMALKALERVDLEAIEEFRLAVQPGIAIPI